MSNPTETRVSEANETHQNAAGEVLRMFWLIWGNAAMLFAAGFVGKQPTWSYTLTDVVFWALVVALLIARFLDIQRFGGLTANTEPATLGHWYRYAPKLVGISAVIWVAAQSVQL